MTEGPYYVNDARIRRDITEGHHGGTPGVPLDLKVTVLDGHVSHTGQLFFPDDVTDQILAVDPYRTHTGTRVLNSQDSIYRGAGGTSAIVALTPLTAGSVKDGFRATITVGIDPSKTPSGVGIGGGQRP